MSCQAQRVEVIRLGVAGKMKGKLVESVSERPWHRSIGRGKSMSRIMSGEFNHENTQGHRWNSKSSLGSDREKEWLGRQLTVHGLQKHSHNVCHVMSGLFFSDLKWLYNKNRLTNCECGCCPWVHQEAMISSASQSSWYKRKIVMIEGRLTPCSDRDQGSLKYIF